MHCGDEYFSESCDAGLMIRTDISHDTLEDGENYTFQPEKQNVLLIAWLNLEEGPVVLSDQIYFLGIKKFKHESFAVYCPYKTINNADENLINNHAAKYSNTKTLLITLIIITKIFHL